jgi:PAS domain S-box-containing protein
MNGGKQKDVVLILARELASNIATPMLVIDETGSIVFFNEAAEKVLGTTFESVGEMSPEEYDTRWTTTDPDGNEISLRQGPLARVVSDHTPAHREIRIRGLDGRWHLIETTVYPLFASASRFVGAVGVFWELGGPFGPASRDAPFRTER